MNLALFDFDGTITRKDSLPDFIQYAVGKKSYYLGLALLSPVLACYFLRLIDNNVAKQKMISHYFKGWETERFKALAEEYSLTQIDLILRPEAIDKLTWHQQQGDRVIVVSASIEDWLKPWCDRKGIELLATKLFSLRGKLSGEFATPNCHGQEKVNRVLEQIKLSDYQTVYAYGDSKGDEAMLAFADRVFYRAF